MSLSTGKINLRLSATSSVISNFNMATDFVRLQWICIICIKQVMTKTIRNIYTTLLQCLVDSITIVTLDIIIRNI